MDSIKNIVSDVIGKMSSGDGGHFKDIQAVWVKISKDEGSRVSDFKDGCVTVSAGSSLRLVKLNLNRESLLKELKKEFPSILKISFKVGAN
jgi:hypothetical protein